MDTCPEGSTWQYPSFVQRDVQTPMSIVTQIEWADQPWNLGLIDETV
jgi:hypothetical protein